MVPQDCQNWGIFRGLAYLVIELIVSGAQFSFGRSTYHIF